LELRIVDFFLITKSENMLTEPENVKDDNSMEVESGEEQAMVISSLILNYIFYFS
jgi:hypothetical protein